MGIPVIFAGASGTQYTYWTLDNPTRPGILAVPGNYCFAKLLPTGYYAPLYFGKAEDLQDRIPGHEQWPDAQRLGVTHVLAHSTPTGGNEQARLAEERDLIQFWNPPLNVQHRTTG